MFASSGLGLFKKKNQEKKSPSSSRKDSKRDNKKSQEDLTDAGKESGYQTKLRPRLHETGTKSIRDDLVSVLVLFIIDVYMRPG